jgi:hypothetical protein
MEWGIICLGAAIEWRRAFQPSAQHSVGVLRFQPQPSEQNTDSTVISRFWPHSLRILAGLTYP